MNHAEHAGTTHILWQETDFLKEVVAMLKGLFQRGLHALDGMNLAVAEGKAFDHLRERLIGSHLDAEVGVEDAPGMPHTGPEGLTVSIVTDAPFPPEAHFQIYQMLAAAHLRYGIRIRAGFQNSQTACRSHAGSAPS